MLWDEKRWLWWVGKKTTELKSPSFNHTHSCSHRERPPSQGQGSYQAVAWADMSVWLMLSMWVILVQHLAKSNWKELSDNPICSKHCSTKHTDHMRVFLIIKYFKKSGTKRNKANQIIMNQMTHQKKKNFYKALFFSTTTKYIRRQTWISLEIDIKNLQQVMCEY